MGDENDHQIIAKQREEQFQKMSKSTALKIKVGMATYKEKHSSASDVDVFMEVAVSMLSSHQRKQGSESNAVIKLVSEEDDKRVADLVKTQELALRLGWFDNVANVVYEADSSHLYEDEDSLSSQ